ncbi:MAG: hypothetical protein K2K32_03515 [Muribaculaceae bacterium]|nr:hypothetical protein [Muribaculaceae bacterium]
MKTEHNILEKVGGKTGFTVPDNYFDSVRSKIMDNLPEYQEKKPEKLSMWRKVQPYVYMAAMFAGIWCMMKMFHMMATSDLSLDNPPESIALAMADADHSEWMTPTDNSDMFMLEDEICSQYSSFEEFKSDFDNSEM